MSHLYPQDPMTVTTIAINFERATMTRHDNTLHDLFRVNDGEFLGGLIRCCFEPVADASHGEQVLRTLRIILNVAAQAHDEIIDGASVGIFPQAPDFLEN